MRSRSEPMQEAARAPLLFCSFVVRREEQKCLLNDAAFPHFVPPPFMNSDDVSSFLAPAFFTIFPVHKELSESAK